MELIVIIAHGRLRFCFDPTRSVPRLDGIAFWRANRLHRQMAQQVRTDNVENLRLELVQPSGGFLWPVFSAGNPSAFGSASLLRSESAASPQGPHTDHACMSAARRSSSCCQVGQQSALAFILFMT